MKTHQQQLAGDAELTSCRLCPRLVAHREAVAQRRRRAYLDQVYWGRPVPSFGDRHGAIVLVGLAPGAHGSNRTGRMFTGDASGGFLYPALFRRGLATQPVSRSRDDALRLRGCFVTAAVRCVPPGNRPRPEELRTCRRWLAPDLTRPRVRVVLALGRIAHDAVLAVWRDAEQPIVKARCPFSHGAEHSLPPLGPQASAVTLLDSYHVSFQNTNTGRLTTSMFDAILKRALTLADPPAANRANVRQRDLRS